MNIQIQQTAHHKQETPPTAFFLYGATGSGKTVAASTFPDPLFLIPANENSYVTLLNHEQSYPFVVIGKDIETGQTLPANQHLHQVLTYLENQYARALQLQAQGKTDEAIEAFPYQTIVVESLTHMTDLVMEAITDYGRKKTTHQTWGAIATFLRTLHDRLRAMDVHIVYTALAQVKTVTVNGAESSRGMPGITGSMAEKMPSACDVIGYCEELTTAKGSTYRVHFRSHGAFVARTRFARMPKFVDNFNFRDLEPFLQPASQEAPSENDQA